MLVSALQAIVLGLALLAYYGHVEPVREQAHSARADGSRWLASHERQLTETQATDGAAGSVSTGDSKPLSENRAGASAAEIERIEAIHRAILANQPIAQWRFETVRTRYMALLKRAGDDPAVEEAIRVKLARVTRHEQAAEAARTMRTILAQSHSRDREVAQVKRRIAVAGRSRAHSFSAVGFMQPSARRIDGRPLYVLIADNGSTVAYLDIPPGLDPDPLVVHRVGVRGVPHFNEELGTRLITVHDLETIEATR